VVRINQPLCGDEDNNCQYRDGGFRDTLSKREFNQDVIRAKKASQNGPVFVTDRGKPAHVLLTIQEYQRLTKQTRDISKSLAVPEGGEDIAFNSPRLNIKIHPVDFS